MQQAKENKKKLEEQWKDKIGSGKHWKDQMTIPEAPKLVGRTNKYSKKPKALNKPISLQDSQMWNESSATSFKRHQNYPQTVKAQEFESTESQAKLLLQKNKENNNELLRINEKSDYDQAQWAIHDYILALDV
mmetsp:Transcript_12030/g.10630  ORF Transcript_12030/g.10630 Transcript_12030/m.10630 type:complete len:133 (+) Transcript_12030:753-1151(+)